MKSVDVLTDESMVVMDDEKMWTLAKMMIRDPHDADSGDGISHRPADDDL